VIATPQPLVGGDRKALEDLQRPGGPLLVELEGSPAENEAEVGAHLVERPRVGVARLVESLQADQRLGLAGPGERRIAFDAAEPLRHLEGLLEITPFELDRVERAQKGRRVRMALQTPPGRLQGDLRVAAPEQALDGVSGALGIAGDRLEQRLWLVGELQDVLDGGNAALGGGLERASRLPIPPQPRQGDTRQLVAP